MEDNNKATEDNLPHPPECGERKETVSEVTETIQETSESAGTRPEGDSQPKKEELAEKIVEAEVDSQSGGNKEEQKAEQVVAPQEGQVVVPNEEIKPLILTESPNSQPNESIPKQEDTPTKAKEEQVADNLEKPPVVTVDSGTKVEAVEEIKKSEAAEKQAQQLETAQSEEKQKEEALKEEQKKKAKAVSKDKLKYLEQKYQEIFKENSARKEDMTKNIELIRLIFAQLGIKIPENFEYRLGEHEVLEGMYKEGIAAYLKRQDGDRKKLEDELNVKFKQQLDLSLKSQQAQQGKREDLLKEADRGYQMSLKLIEEQNQKKQQETKEGFQRNIKNLEELNKKMERENGELLVVLRKREREMEELRLMNQSLMDSKTESLMTRFEGLESEQLDKQQEESSRLDEMIKLRNELDEAYARIDSLEESLISFSKKKSTKEGVSEVKGSKELTDKESQTEQDEGSGSSMVELKKKKGEKLEEHIERENRLKRLNEEEESSRVYFKSLVIKYMIYEVRKNEQEALIMRRAILDYLKVDSTERALIDDAVSGRGGLKDSIYFFKLFGGSN
jgi:hypothetical protein